MSKMTNSEKTDLVIKEMKETSRIHSIDFLRGLTIVSMIIWHIYLFWVKIRYDDIIHSILYFFGTIAGPIFLIISGISLHLLIEHRLLEKIENKKIFFEMCKRGLFIFIIATILSDSLAWIFTLEGRLLKWSLFQVIGASLLLGFFINKLKNWIIILIIIIVFSLTQFYDLGLLPIFYLLFEGVFEFFPFINYFLIGIILGKSLFGFNLLKENRYKLILIIGVSLFICGIFFVLLINFKDISTFLIIIGLFLIIFIPAQYWLDKRSKTPFIINSLEQWGRISFSIYYLQFGIIYSGLFLFSIFLNEFYNIGFPVYLYLIFLIIVLVIIEIFRLIWKKFKYIFGLEWFMNIIVKKSLFELKKKLNSKP